MKPLISIIIPVYNHAQEIMRSLQTIFHQTYRPLEIVMINDGSTDNFKLLQPVILERAKSFGISTTIIHQENKGAAAARNKGFSMSQGEYVIFWDADTIAQPEMLEKMFQALQQHPEVSYAYSQFKFGWKTMKSRVFNEDDLKKYNYIDTTSLVRRNDFCGFDESIKRFQDWDLWLTLLEKKKMGINIPSVLYRKIISFHRMGMSTWLPSFMYRLPWNTKKVLIYKYSQEIIRQKHGLSDSD